MQEKNTYFTPITIILIVVNVIIFAVEEFMLGGSTSTNFITDNFTMYTPFVLEGQVWRIFTAMFLHFGITHILFNMMALYNLGRTLEIYLGGIKYTVVYLLGGICGNLMVLAVDLITGSSALGAGASGAIFALLGVYITIAIKNKKAGINIASLLSSIVFAMLPGFLIPGISWSAHLGGLIGGFLISLPMVKKVE